MSKEIARLVSEIDEIRTGLERGLYRDEAAVCNGIVDRLLQCLGWTTTDITLVCREYKIANGRVDYALCDPVQHPIVLIEAKRVGALAGAEEQLFSYAFHQGVPMLVLTDGKVWRFFYPSGTGPYAQRLVCELDLSDPDSDKNAYRLQRYLRFAAIHKGVAIETFADDYKKLVGQREASRHLPQTWQKLVDMADEFLIEVLAEATEADCGYKPSNEHVLGFLKTLKSPQEGCKEDENDVPPPAPTTKKEKYQSYFQALNTEMTQQHNFTDGSSYSRNNVYFFPFGDRGIWYYAHFVRGRQVSTGLQIDFTKKEENKNFFDILIERKSEINARFDAPLRWNRRDEQRACTLGFRRDGGGDIEADARELEVIRAWHVENLLKLREVFTPEIRFVFEKLKSREF
ncbi:MAG: DUF4268 domain-containing protein [Candidatus Poribacteria bacterium]|nr:DUF4268 domain-containing protein [Candidatus Poribacteria bacterium]